MNFYLDGFKRYADFSGRSGRAAFWLFTVVNLVIYNVALQIELATGWIIGTTGMGPLTAAMTLALLLPAIAVTVRRLHDAGFSGALALLALVPLLGWLALVVLCALPGSRGENKYGVRRGWQAAQGGV